MKKLLLTVCSIFVLALSAKAIDTDASIKAVVTPYIQIHDALAKDSLDGVSTYAMQLSKAASAKLFPAELKAEADALAAAKDLDSARAAFKPLSATLIKLVEQNHYTGCAKAYCPMVKAYWLQSGNTVSNPFGAEMSTCGEIVTEAK